MYVHWTLCVLSTNAVLFISIKYLDALLTRIDFFFRRRQTLLRGKLSVLDQRGWGGGARISSVRTVFRVWIQKKEKKTYRNINVIVKQK